MTEALYLDATDDRSLDATVERVAGDRVVLDRTLFYPEGGGQPADRGRIEAADGRTWRVTDVQKQDTIYHHLELASDAAADAETDADGESVDPPEPDTQVTGHLDWERRYAHMRYHTAQHLLSAVLLEEFDARTTGNQLYADRARIDCEYDRFTDADFADIEAWMNDKIEAGLPVRWYEMDRETAEAELDPERTRIRLLPDSITEIRIVEIADLDRTACAGTHVESTDEVGTFSVTGRETKGSDEERLSFELD